MTNEKSEEAGWRDDWPDWRDSGRVEVTLDDGRVVAGRLAAYDFLVMDDGDEAPIWSLDLPDGSRIDDLTFARWRKAKDPEPSPNPPTPPIMPASQPRTAKEEASARPKRFLVFAFNHYEALGGWNDLADSFATLQEAVAHMDSLVASTGPDGDVQVVDLSTGEIVEERIRGATS